MNDRLLRHVILFVGVVFVLGGIFITTTQEGIVRTASGAATVAVSGAKDQLPATSELSALNAAILGTVEGLTEFLPVSSTGHLEITHRLLGIGKTEVTKESINSYQIVIQAGAIVAVFLLYFNRIKEIVYGIFGKNEKGRDLLINLLISFSPAAILGFLLGDVIKDRLFGVWPVAIAWIVGGVAIIFWARRSHRYNKGLEIGSITARIALMVGLSQALALWPGVSRSLVTILAAVLCGLSIKAAVEYAFILGLVTLGAATIYEGFKNGDQIISTFGALPVSVGFATAFVFAFISAKWMVSYLERHDFSIFGWYRIGVGALALAFISLGIL